MWLCVHRSLELESDELVLPYPQAARLSAASCFILFLQAAHMRPGPHNSLLCSAHTSVCLCLSPPPSSRLPLIVFLPSSLSLSLSLLFIVTYAFLLLFFSYIFRVAERRRTNERRTFTLLFTPPPPIAPRPQLSVSQFVYVHVPSSVVRATFTAMSVTPKTI